MTDTLAGDELGGRTVLVGGGTGNVGAFLVDGFIRAGARVLVPSRSQAKLDRLLARLAPEKASRGAPIIGDVGTPDGAKALQAAVARRAADLFAVAAAPAGWHQTTSMLESGFADFMAVIENSLYPHYLAAEAFLPLLDPAGSYTTINGPVGFMGSPPPGIGPMAVVSVAQDKLVHAFAAETGGRPRVNDVVMRAFLGPQGTRPGSPITGEQVGDFVAALASPLAAGVHNQTLHLNNLKQIQAALAGDFSHLSDGPQRPTFERTPS